MKPSARKATVLFADVTGSTQLYETAGDVTASTAIAACMDVLRRAVEDGGGRVVKTIGDEVMALFPTPDTAAAAAARMHLAVEALPDVKGRKLSIRIAFHSGPVLQRGGDVFGDTVNLASRLVEQAVKGQVLTCDETASLLSPVVRNSTRQLYAVRLKGKADKVALCEFVWRRSADTTDLPSTRPLGRLLPTLRLRYRGRDLPKRRAREAVLIGRHSGCQLVIADRKASRQHCTIERREGYFVLQDHSVNGTFLTVEGEPEVVLRRQELPLRNRGWIALGQPRHEAPEVIEYYCEDDPRQR